MKALSICFLICLALFSSALSWLNMIYWADSLSPFYNDEIANDQSAVSFFSKGMYKSDSWGFIYSSGIATTWPSAVGWYLGHNMLSSRLSCAFFSWFFSLLLGFCFFIRCKCSRIDSIAAAVCLWAVTITSPLSVPYWFGFMYNLGELNAIILVGFGIFLLSNYPFLSAFIFGIAFWQGKFIYFPLNWAILLGDILSRKSPLNKKAVRLFGYSITFLLPLVFWLALVSLNFNFSFAKKWLFDQLGWFNHMKSVHVRVSSAGITLDTLWKRLTSPEFEWVRYTFGNKLKNLLFSLGAIGITFFGIIIAKKKKLIISDKEKWISVLSAACIGFYCVFYFFLNSYMWQRYFHPAIYTGFGLIVFWLSKLIRNSSINFRPVLYSAAIFLIILQWINSAKNKPFQSPSSYARSCSDLYGFKCNPELYKDNRQK